MKSYNLGDILTANEFDEMKLSVTTISKNTKDEEAVAQIDVVLKQVDKAVKDLEYFRLRISEYSELKDKLQEIMKAMPITDDVVDFSSSLKQKLH